MSDASHVFTSNFLVAAASVAKVRARALNRRVPSAFREIVVRVEPTVTVEVGAFEATFSRWAREHHPQARVIAYEANPYTHELFRDELSCYGVDYVNACVGAEAGQVLLHVPRDFKGKEFELGRNQMASLRTSLVTERHEQVEVPCVRLDDVVDLAPEDRLVAWIDVEGALDEVLNGSRDVLSRASAVFVEVEDTPIWEGQWLDVDAYRWFADIGMVPILRDMQRPGQYNVVFVNATLARDPATARLAAQVYTSPPPGSPDRLEASADDRHIDGRPVNELRRRLDQQTARADALAAEVAALRSSTSWRLTKPVRAVGGLFRRGS